MFRAVFWVILPCKIVDRRFNHFTRQYNPEDSSEHHTRRRENLKSHTVVISLLLGKIQLVPLLISQNRSQPDCIHDCEIVYALSEKNERYV
jgi:hypothetical protein